MGGQRVARRSLLAQCPPRFLAFSTGAVTAAATTLVCKRCGLTLGAAAARDFRSKPDAFCQLLSSSLVSILYRE